MSEEEENKCWMETGEWAAMTLGQLAELLIDLGDTDVPFVRVIGQTPVNETGHMQVHFEVHLIPNGEVLQHAKEIGCKKFNHRTLSPLIEKGLVK